MNKIFFILLISVFIVGNSAFADNNQQIKDAISAYKAKNYVGCIQDMQDILEKDPSNALAHYYLGISYTQIGKKEDALSSYNKVVDLSTNSTLTKYAEKGLLCLNSPEVCLISEVKEIPDTDLDKFIKSGKVVSDDVKKELKNIHLKQLKDRLNHDVNTQSSMPSNDEIAEAVKTLAKIGINPLGNSGNIAQMQNIYSNPEYQQLQMLLGDDDSYSNMFKFGFGSVNSNNNKLSADMIKNMMMTSMIGNMTTYDIGNN